MAQAIAVMGLVLAAYQAYQSYEGAQTAKEIGEQNQKNIEMEAEEQARRERFNLSREKALIRARVAAAGIKGITPEEYYKSFTEQRENEIRWITTSAKSRGAVAKVEGGRAATVGYSQAAGQAFQGIQQGYNWYSTYVK